MYDYPLEPDWSTEEIIEVVGLYNAVEQAYEEVLVLKNSWNITAHLRLLQIQKHYKNN